MADDEVWICAACKRPIEIKERYGELGIFCPVNDGRGTGKDRCTPREDRELLCGFQVERLDGTPVVEEGSVL